MENKKKKKADDGSAHKVEPVNQPAPFMSNGNICFNVSTLQAAAGHNMHLGGIGNVQLHGEGNEFGKL